MSSVRRVVVSSETLYVVRYRPRNVLIVAPRKVRWSLRKHLMVNGVTLLVIALVVLIAYRLIVKPPPDSVTSPPIYPGAEKIAIERPDANIQNITFRTNAPNSEVRAYYRDILTRDGWQSDIYGNDYYTWSPVLAGSNSSDSYCLYINFKGYTQTEVSLRLDKNCSVERSFGYQTYASPTPVVITPINITRAQYEQALAKWKASGIDEYIISLDTFAFLGGSKKLHVSDGGQKITPMTTDGTPVPTPDAEALEYLKEDTVEGLFEEIEGMLDEGQIIHSGAIMSTGEFYMAYKVEFDPDFGYPVEMSGHPVTAPGAVVFDADWDRTVSEFSIIKRNINTPGVP